MLSPFRALDLTDEKGFLCGKVLGDLGADVIKIEPPGGGPARNIGPFYQDIPDPEKSLYWFAYNANKRGITLNIETTDGQEIFKRLVKSADFVIESFPPGYMDGLGLGYSNLSKINPRIVVASISPFGQTGPFSNYKGSDIVATAMSGFMSLCGDPDRPPVRISFPQAYAHAGVQAAVGLLIAHYHREITGEGQHVDVSAQESMVTALYNARHYWEARKINIQRAGRYRRLGGIALVPLIWPCKDGYVSFGMFGGPTGADTNRRLVEWMDSEGMAPDFMKNIDWSVYDLSKVTQEEADWFIQAVEQFFIKHTKAEIFDEAGRRSMMLYLVSTIKDIVEDPQLSAREFWTEVEHPELGATITYPGAFVKLTETPCRFCRKAPLIGEHNQEIYENELGFSQQELIILKQGNVI